MSEATEKDQEPSLEDRLAVVEENIRHMMAAIAEQADDIAAILAAIKAE